MAKMIAASAPEDWKAALAVLERRYPAEWGKTDKLDAKVEHAGEVKIVLKLIDNEPTD